MNKAHLQSEDWAQYLAAFEPQNEKELGEYLDDLYKTAAVDRNQAAINLNAINRVVEQHPEWEFRVRNHRKEISRMAAGEDEQSRIRRGFYE